MNLRAKHVTVTAVMRNKAAAACWTMHNDLVDFEKAGNVCDLDLTYTPWMARQRGEVKQPDMSAGKVHGSDVSSQFSSPSVSLGQGCQIVLENIWQNLRDNHFCEIIFVYRIWRTV
jgi:hypothetical protein